MRVQGLTGLAVVMSVDSSVRKKWSTRRLEGWNQPVVDLLFELVQRPLFDMAGTLNPIELRGAVPEAEAPALRALLESMLDLTVALGGRGELAEFALDGEVRCFLWEGRKRALPVPHEDRRVKTDFVMVQKHLREDVRKYVPPQVSKLRCSCGAPVAPDDETCLACKRDFTAPLGIESRPEDHECLRPLRSRLMELKVRLPDKDVFRANVFRPSNAFEMLMYEELLPEAGLELTEPRELRRRVELLEEVEQWPRRYRLPGVPATSAFASWCDALVALKKPAVSRVLEQLAREQEHRFKEVADIVPDSPGWHAAGELSFSSLPILFAYKQEHILDALDFVRRFAGARVALSERFLDVLLRIAPERVPEKERKLHEQDLDARALSTGTGLGDYLKRRSAKAKSKAHALAAVLAEAGNPDADDSARRALKELSRAVVEWLAEGRRQALDDIEAPGLVGQLEAVKRAKLFPKAILESAERARLHPAPFGLTGGRCWDVQPGRLAEPDEKARVACPECGRRVTPSRVFHLPALDTGLEARTLRLYECERCDRSLLFARVVKPARAPRTPVRAFVEFRAADALEKPLPKGFVAWRHERFLERQHEGHRLALQVGGLPLLPAERDASLDLDLRCGHPFVRIRIHTRALDLQPGFGGSAIVGGMCMTPGCKKPDVRTERDD
ncbi:hypothetical protein ACN47A_20970 [Myxococcus fulvus]|uniref:hypothetical protein n=1 Tax=Myxococcus fulvus TaxID=33 RepID=UPI003B9C36DD